jgi:acyl-CoA reductase-like NAD-dependent aldehyde dehydrogenase
MTASDTRLLTGGERAAGSGAALAVENPYTEHTLETIGSASAEQIDAAVRAGSRRLLRLS